MIASGLGASYRQYERCLSALRKEKIQRTPSAAFASSMRTTSSLVASSCSAYLRSIM